MTDEELDQLIASLTDDELLRMRERLTDPDDVPDDPNGAFVRQLFASGDD